MTIQHFIIFRSLVHEFISRSAILLSAAADHGSCAVGNEYVRDIQHHIVPYRLIQNFTGKLNFRPFALDHGKRLSLTGIYQYVCSELLSSELESHLTHHHMKRYFKLIREHSDAPLADSFFWSQTHVLLSQRIKYRHGCKDSQKWSFKRFQSPFNKA